MTGPGQPMSDALRKARQRLLRLGLTDDHILTIPTPASPSFDPAQLDPHQADPHFSPVVQRVVRFLRGGRGLSIAVTDDEPRGDARVQTAVQLAAGLARHGIHAVLVDMDLQHPGLNGLVPDAHSEGLIDMVRFGRSCRTLLQKPLSEGPSLLAAGSFPVQEPLPLDEDAIRSVLHRVSLHCELALYVAPLLPDGRNLNPVVRLCEHVVLVQSVSETSVDVVERIQLMQQARLHVAGVVLFEGRRPPAFDANKWRPGSLYDDASAPSTSASATAASAAPAQPQAPQPAPASPAPTPASPAPAQGQSPGPPPAPPGGQPPVEPANPAGDTVIPHIPWTGRYPRPLAAEASTEHEIPEIHLPGEEEQGGPFSSQPQPFGMSAADAGVVDDATSPSEPGDPERHVGAETIERLWSEPEQPPQASLSLEEGVGGAEADPEPHGADYFERAGVGNTDSASTDFPPPDFEDAETEFAYDDGNNWSRTPLYILATLLVLVGGFFGWALWTKRGIEQQVGQQLSDTNWIDAPQSPAASTVPDDAAAMPPGDATLPATGLQGVGDPSNDRNMPAPAQAEAGEDAGTSSRPTSPAAVSGGAGTDTEEMAPVKVPSMQIEAAGPAGGDQPTRPSNAAGGSTAGPTPAPAGKPPTAATPGSTTNGEYTVHVGSFRHLEQAYQDIATLQKHGYMGRAVKTDLGNKGVWYRVYVGGFTNRSEAEKTRDAILELPEYRYAQVKRLP